MYFFIEKLMTMDEISKLASDSMKDISDGDSDDDIEDEDLLVSFIYNLKFEI